LMKEQLSTSQNDLLQERRKLSKLTEEKEKLQLELHEARYELGSDEALLAAEKLKLMALQDQMNQMKSSDHKALTETNQKLARQVEETSQLVSEFEVEKGRFQVSLSMLQAQLETSQENWRHEMHRKVDEVVQQRDQLGDALRMETAGMEARYKIDITKLSHDLEMLGKEKEELDSTLSIMHSDFDRALGQAVPVLVAENEELKASLATEKETLVEVMGLLSTRDQEYHDILVTNEELECKFDMELNKSRLDHDVMQAKVRELEDQVTHLQDLLHFKSRAATPCGMPQTSSPSDTEFAQLRDTERELQTVRAREILLERQALNLTEEVSALKIQILVFDTLKEDGDEGGERDGGGGDEGDLQHSVRLKQQSIRDEMAWNVENASDLKKMNKNLENELLQERLQSQQLLEELRITRENSYERNSGENEDRVTPLSFPSISQFRTKSIVEREREREGEGEGEGETPVSP